MFNLGILANQITALKTVNPSITNASATANGLGYDYTWRCRNLDTVSVVMYSNALTTPTTNRGTISASGYTSYIIFNSIEFGITVYAKAQATGKEMSDTVSTYIEPR